MTAWTEIWTPNLLLSEGADAVLTKPFELQELLRIVDRFVNSSREFPEAQRCPARTEWIEVAIEQQDHLDQNA